MKKITIWERKDPHADTWRFNHQEDGHASGDTPNGSKSQLKYWSNDIWRKTHAIVDEQGNIRDTNGKHLS